jgi:hypothetical protein
MRLLKLLFLLLLVNCAHPADAQYIPWEKDKPLVWKDFAGTPDENSSFTAVTSSHIEYSYHCEWRDSVYKVTFQLKNLFNTQRSWCKKRNKDLLHHEQLHFDINEVFTRRLFVAFNSATYTANYKEEIRAIYDKFIAEERDFQTKYDSQTIHSKDWGSQVVWVQFIHKELDELPRNY